MTCSAIRLVQCPFRPRRFLNPFNSLQVALGDTYNHLIILCPASRRDANDYTPNSTQFHWETKRNCHHSTLANLEPQKQRQVFYVRVSDCRSNVLSGFRTAVAAITLQTHCKRRYSRSIYAVIQYPFSCTKTGKTVSLFRCEQRHGDWAIPSVWLLVIVPQLLPRLDKGFFAKLYFNHHEKEIEKGTER